MAEHIGIAAKYQIPAELMAFVEEGFLEVLSEKESEKTIEFHIPEKMMEFTRDHLMAYNLIWIHPDYNAEFCHFCIDEPGDLPNFYLYRHFSDDADDFESDLETVDDLVDWLEQLRVGEVA